MSIVPSWQAQSTVDPCFCREVDLDLCWPWGWRGDGRYHTFTGCGLIPDVPHKGPDDTAQALLAGAASKLSAGYLPGGSNVTSAVVAILRMVAGSDK